MNKIESYQDLLNEEMALQSALLIYKDIVQKDIVELKEQLRPATNLASFLSKLVTRDSSNPLLTTGLGMAGDLIFKNILLARSGWLTRLIVPYLIKNYSSHLLNKGGAITLLQKLSGKLKSH